MVEMVGIINIANNTNAIKVTRKARKIFLLFVTNLYSFEKQT
jgi:hypothetical protein